MSVSYTLVDIADQIHRELIDTTDVSVPFIIAWFRSNLGNLNSLLHTCYVINDTTQEVDPKLGIQEGAIFKDMFLIRHYDRLIQRTLKNSLTDAKVIEVTSADRKVKLTNPKDVSLIYLELRKEAQKSYNTLLASYSMDKAVPIQIAGDDAGIS